MASSGRHPHVGAGLVLTGAGDHNAPTSFPKCPNPVTSHATPYRSRCLLMFRGGLLPGPELGTATPARSWAVNLWGLREGGAGCWPRGRALMGLTLGCLGLPGPRCPPPHSSFLVRNQATDAGELALGLRGRPRPPWVAAGETQAEPWTPRFRSDTLWGLGGTAALCLSSTFSLSFFLLV